MQPIQLIDSRPRFDPRIILFGLLVAGATLFAALILGRVMNIEQQVLTLVILDILLLTAFVAFYDITNAVVLWFFALTLIGRYTQLNLPGIPDMSGPRFMLVLMWAVFLVEVAMGRRRPLPLGRIELWMLVFMGAHLGNMIYYENLVGTPTRLSPITPFFNFVVFPFSIYYLVRNACASDVPTRKLWKALAVLQIYLALNGIFEHFKLKWLVFPPDILDPKAGYGRWFGARIRGPYLHTPVYGATMGMCFFLLLHAFNYTRSRWRWAMLAGLIATPLACFYTLTRQVWVGFVLPLMVGPLFSRRQRIMIGLLVLVALTFVFTVNLKTFADPDVVRRRATDESTGEARLAHFVVAAHMFMDKPIFGQGLMRWEQVWESYRRPLGKLHSMFGDLDMDRARGTDAHNTFLRIAVELGLVGFIPYILIYWYIFQSSFLLFRRSRSQGFFGRELVISFWQLSIAFLVCISFVDPSFDEFLPGVFFATAAVIVRRSELAAAGGERAPGAEGTTFGEAG